MAQKFIYIISTLLAASLWFNTTNRLRVYQRCVPYIHYSFCSSFFFLNYFLQAPIRNLICHLLPNGIPIVAAITSCGCVVYRTDNFDAMPIVLGCVYVRVLHQSNPSPNFFFFCCSLNQPLGAVAARGAQLAVATVNKQVFIWNVEKEMEKKSATESIVAEDDVIDIGSQGFCASIFSCRLT